MIGPHQGREMDFMSIGRKHVAMVSDWQFGLKWKEFVAENNLKTLLIRSMGGNSREVIITRDGHHWKAERLRKIYLACRARNHINQIDHARIGLLLGYDKDDIREFLNRQIARAA